ncbi:deoxynucleoside monophosphate kinase [Aeromonas phage JELG-KS1]|uniref:Deoxynucleoside monophosphate kinase n=1 Tax=Aeromonas phage JELG-KS1 TaxID=2951233 RepID=A0A9E7T0Y1_9CAUD|nr:deoxynucleoside monophosphate kinase [Aeromonas phage JELG-KS1]
MSNKPIIISLSAPRPQSGKDTLANQLVEHFGKDRVATVAFGDYLRDCVSHLFGAVYASAVREMLDDSRKDEPSKLCRGINIVHAEYREFLVQKGINLYTHQTPRFHMQMFGNDFIKGHMGLTDFWVDVVDRRIAWLMRTKPNLKYIIVTDTRSPNEFEWLSHHGAEFFMVKRAGFPKDKHDDRSTVHPVETHADSWKYDKVLWNHFGEPERLLDQCLSYFDL